jgi:hypothetical protein
MFFGLLGKPILFLHKCFQLEILEGIFNIISTIFHMFPDASIFYNARNFIYLLCGGSIYAGLPIDKIFKSPEL